MNEEPRSSDTWERARGLYEDGRFEEVLETLEGEESVEALFLAASALYELGEHEESESVCTEALGIAELPELRHLEALLLLQRAEPEKAHLEALELGERSDPLLEPARGLGTGREAIELGQPVLAIDLLLHVLEVRIP